MKWTSPKRAVNVPALLRQAGYHPIVDRREAKQSWVRNVGAAHYPRFHLYTEERSDGSVDFNLHLDQKQASLGSKRHAGEYAGMAVENELERIKRWYAYVTRT